MEVLGAEAHEIIACSRKRDVIGEDHSKEEEERRERDDGPYVSALVGIETGCDEAPNLPENERYSEHERGVERDLDIEIERALYRLDDESVVRAQVGVA